MFYVVGTAFTIIAKLIILHIFNFLFLILQIFSLKIVKYYLQILSCRMEHISQHFELSEDL
jgi:hypothetical protein